ncbi:MAG: hypothetical protein H0T12_07485 [Actinobacteria bacterium]|nr:hypothetical protein [Actinomycetota bacterium]
MRRRLVGRASAIVAGVALLAASPALLTALPVPEPHVGAGALLQRVLDSQDVSYSGLAVSRAGLKLPDVRGAGRLAALFGESTRMRVWYESPVRWRVDELTPVGERDVYLDSAGTLFWDSGSRIATRILGKGEVRFARPADLLPSELGRRLATASSSAKVASLPAERIAGVTAAGVRVSPVETATTLSHADLWADPVTGLVLRVELTARGFDEPIISASFLELEQRPPPAGLTHFDIPADAAFQISEAPDFARAVNRYSPFVLPDSVAGYTLRSQPARAAGTYGKSFELVAVLAVPLRFFPAERLEGLPEVSGPWGSGRLARSPLLNALTIVDVGREIAYVLGGTVKPSRLIEVASSLYRQGVGLSG